MRILYVSTISNTVNTFLIPHIKMLVEQGHQVDVACNIVKEIDPKLVKLGCKIHNLEFHRSPLHKGNYKAYRDIKRIVLKGKYDLVHTHTPNASFLTRIACRNIPDLKVLYTAHGFHFFKGAPLKNWIIYYPLEKLAAKYTDVIITINQEDYDIAKKMKLRQPNSVFKIHGVGVYLDKYSSSDITERTCLRKKQGYNNEDLILLYAAELNFNKHQDLLINAINELKTRIPQVKLLLAGEGQLMEYYKGLVKKLDLNNNVFFLGYRKDIPDLLKMADIGVASSRREGLPVNVMEAMAKGLPLVVTNCRGQKDLVEDNENGYIVEKNDIKGFANAIETIYTSKNIMTRFSESSMKKVKTYSISNVIQEMENIYSRLDR